MLKVILTRGLPGSGKTTWANKLILDNPNSYKRVNKDELRQMLDAGKYSKDSEKFVLLIRDTLILAALSAGKHVIVDDTNLAPKHEAWIREITKGLAEFQIKDFTGVAVEDCIRRDLTRPNSVGEKVIRDMYNQFLRPKPEAYTEDENLPHAIIVDIDGTLALKGDRNPYDWDKVGEDELNVPISDLVYCIAEYGNGRYVILFSGRDSVCQNITEEWLQRNQIPYDALHMRPEGNMEKDSIIKRRMFEQYIRGKYYIDFVLDDRNQVVQMWRDMGLICLQVADGNF